LQEEGYDSLCQELSKDELNVPWAKKSSSAVPSDRGWMAYYGRMILASVDRTLLEAIIYGNVALERRSNQKLERHLRSLWTQSSRQPSIYMQLFVSTNGLSPTPTEIERLCVLMETHLSSTGNTFVREVGDIFNSNSATARRSANKDYQAYTWTEQVDHTKEGFQSERPASSSIRGWNPATESKTFAHF
jgi:hypothetical protein